MHYTGTIWRPPYEADSLIIEATAGCTNHQYRFCTSGCSGHRLFVLLSRGNQRQGMRHRGRDGTMSYAHCPLFARRTTSYVLAVPCLVPMSYTQDLQFDVGKASIPGQPASPTCNGLSFIFMSRLKRTGQSRRGIMAHAGIHHGHGALPEESRPEKAL